MNGRRGEKLGWTLGLLGGSAWMFILAAVASFGGDLRLGAVALSMGLFVVGLVHQLAPWKHPSTRYWKLFLPPVAAILLAAGILASWAGHGLPSFEAWAPSLLILAMMCLLPRTLWRRWEDGEKTAGLPEA